MTALYVAFTLISLPAYVAMAHPKDDDAEYDDDDAAAFDDGPFFKPPVATHVVAHKIEASAPQQRKNPISGFFQRARLRT